VEPVTKDEWRRVLAVRAEMYRRLYGTTEVETVPWKFLSALYDLADVATELEDMPEKLDWHCSK
jgi:hypothetical protein